MIDFSIPQKYRSTTDTKRLNLALETTLHQLGINHDEAITLKITDNKSIQKLNRLYRQFDEPTDVLSFENDYVDLETGIHFLGDIVISYEKALMQAQSQNHLFQQELEMLLIHGILHLCGYDHLDEDEFLEMSQQQDAILSAINNPLLKSIYHDE
ncbi:MAG: rRNA maturation RNase YbeY [Anaerolineaceae bacterium]